MGIRKCVAVIALSSTVALVPLTIGRISSASMKEPSKIVTGAVPVKHSEGDTQDDTMNYKQSVDISNSQREASIIDNNVHKRWKVPLSLDLQNYISRLCRQYNVPEPLVYSVMETESEFNPNKISSTGDYGLFQINLCNQKWLTKRLGITNYLNPYQNIKGGIFMLADLVRKYGSLNKVLVAYNMGEGGMQQLFARGITSTIYCKKVMDNMRALHHV